MFLKSIELFGFKSFADKTRIEFSRGIAALLGPNGCGKSNIVDAIKWVLGEQNIRNLRADKMENIIFNGSETRKPLNVAEVTITFVNNNELLPLGVSEISVTRRLFRSGESQYFINGNPVRLKEIRELFFDTGIGKSAYSIMEQGKIDHILSNKPDERRLIFEEAAGITKFKIKSAEAERKLKSTEDNMKQLTGILGEIKKNYETLKIQAEKAQLYRELQKTIFDVETNLSLLRLRKLLEKKERLYAQKEEIQVEKDRIKETIDRINSNMESSISAVNDMESELIELQNRLYKLGVEENGIENTVRMLEERVSENKLKIQNLFSRKKYLEERLAKNKEKKESIFQRINELSRSETDLSNNVISFERSIKDFFSQIESNNKLIESKDRENANLENKLENLREDLRRITDNIVTQLDEGLKRIGYSTERKTETERKIKERLHVLKMYVVDSISLETATAEKLKEIITELDKLFNEYITYNLSFLDEFLSTEGIITLKRKIDDEIRTSLNVINSNKETIVRKRQENRELNDKLDNYRTTLESLKINRTKIIAEIEGLNREIRRLEEERKEYLAQIEENKDEIEDIEKLIGSLQSKIKVARKEKEKIKVRKIEFQEKLKKLEKAIKESNSSLISTEETLKRAMGKMNKTQARLEKLQIEIAQIETEIDGLYKNYRETHSRELGEFEDSMYEINEDPAQLREKLKALKQKISTLGHINLMAPEEFKEVEERYNFLTSQLKDLEEAKKNLIDVTKHIKKESSDLFFDSYNKIKKNFHLMFRRLFGGGRAELKLTDPSNVLESGIEIFAQPPGKKFESLSLLSGGERSLTAVALLFAMYMVKPSPFCILDEIDAALDENNVEQFANLLKEFTNRSQFIVISHNKKTVAMAETLYGVTMEESGVSKMIAVRVKERDEVASIV